MRLAFMGSPEFAVPALTALHEAGHTIAAVYCQPPRPAHRGHALTRCAVHEAAVALDLPVHTPSALRNAADEQQRFAEFRLDACVVAAYGLILPAAMLKAPARGCLNIHASLLPRWRGAAPIHRAIEAGDAQTGITIMQMDIGLDTGPILLSQAVDIGPRDTQKLVQERLAQLGAGLILRALNGNPVAVPQTDSGITYAAKLVREDGRLDFSQSADTLARRVRAFVPWPGTFATFGGEILKVLEAEATEGSGIPGQVLDATFRVACGTGALRLTRVQRPGRPATAGDAMLRGVAWKDWERPE